MIPFRWSKVSNYDGTPILKDVEIDALSEMLLGDYNPKLLKEPGKVDWCHFLEYYLGTIALAPILNKNSITIRLVA